MFSEIFCFLPIADNVLLYFFSGPDSSRTFGLIVTPILVLLGTHLLLASIHHFELVWSDCD